MGTLAENVTIDFSIKFDDELIKPKSPLYSWGPADNSSSVKVLADSRVIPANSTELAFTLPTHADALFHVIEDINRSGELTVFINGDTNGNTLAPWRVVSGAITAITVTNTDTTDPQYLTVYTVIPQGVVFERSGTIAIPSNNILGLLHGTNVDNPSTGVHGVTGTIVGTSDTQTLTNKTIDPSANTIDGDKLDIDFTPSNYTPDSSPAEADDTDDLAAHLKGIDSALTTSGQANTASNVGTAGVGVFKQKTGVDLEFKKINAGSSKITITDDTGNDEVDIDVAEANLTITESQISDLGSYITASSTDTLTNKTINTASNTITIVEADISDLGSYITASSTDTLTNKTFDANGVGNSLSNVETADIASGSKSGADTTLITGTAGTSGNLSTWNVDGDLVDGPTPPSGDIVGTTDSQTLTNKTIATASNTITSASTTATGVVELATTAETDTGTDTGRAVTPDGLAGSYAGTKSVQFVVTDFTTATATGDGQMYFHVPSALNGMDLVAVHAEVITAGTTGTTDIQIHNVTDVADMLTTKITIDSTETGSDTAATPAVINTAADDVVTNDLLRVDVDAVSTTPAQGLIITLEFRLP